MKHNIDDFLKDLPIGPDTLAVLGENNIHTVRDLSYAFLEQRLGAFLSTGQHIEVIKAAWTWIMQPFETQEK